MSADASYIDKIPYVDSGFIITADFLREFNFGYLGYWYATEEKPFTPFEAVTFDGGEPKKDGPPKPGSAFDLFQKQWPDGIEAQQCFRHLISTGQGRFAFNLARTLAAAKVEIDCTTEIDFPLEGVGFVAIAGNFKVPSVLAEGICVTGVLSSALIVDAEHGIDAGGDLASGFGGLISSKGAICSNGKISSSGPISAGKWINASGIRSEVSISADEYINSEGRISTPGYIFVKNGRLTAKTNIYAGTAILVGEHIEASVIKSDGRIHCGFSPTHKEKYSPGGITGHVDDDTPVYGVAYAPKIS